MHSYQPPYPQKMDKESTGKVCIISIIMPKKSQACAPTCLGLMQHLRFLATVQFQPALHYWTAALLHGGAAWWTADGIVASADEAVIVAGCDLRFHMFP